MIYSLLEQQDGSLKVTLVSKNARLIRDKPAPTSPSLAPSSSTLPTPETTTQNAEASSKPALPPPTTSSQIMYSDEESTPFFRRLAFATDGSLLITPAGQYEDPSGTSSAKKAKKLAQQPQNGDADASVVIDSSSPVIAKKPISKNNGTSATKVKNKNAGPSATSYIFARGQFGNETPIGHLPGHRTASIVVKFNPVLWNLRSKKGMDAKGKGKEKASNVDDETKPGRSETGMAVDGSAKNGTENESAKAEEVQKIGREIRQEAGIYDLKQKTIYAVATHDTISIYDTQQEAPVCMFSSLHFAAFTDLAWYVSP